MEPAFWTVEFKDLAAALASSPKGFAWLTGVERGPAGIDAKSLAAMGCPQGAAESCSFCVDGSTYTAFEDPDDGYRSALGLMVARKGNWCECVFEPCALVANFNRGEGEPATRPKLLLSPADPAAAEAFLMELRHPLSMQIALQVGTSHAEDWYPCFVAFHDPSVLESARALGIALAAELDDDLPGGPSAARPRL